MPMGQMQEGNMIINDNFFERGRGRGVNGNIQNGEGTNGMMRINGQNYNTPSGKLDGLQREMIFSHFSDKHVIMEQVYENGKKVMHSNVFSNGMKISFTNENLPKKISFINPDYFQIASNTKNLLYKEKVLKILKKNRNLSCYTINNNSLRINRLNLQFDFESLVKLDSNNKKEASNINQKEKNSIEDSITQNVKAIVTDNNKSNFKRAHSLGDSPKNGMQSQERIKYKSDLSHLLKVENVILEGNVDDIANPKKGDGFMCIRGQEIFLEFEITKNKRIIFDYMGKKVRGVKNMISFVEKEIWGEDSDNEEDLERRLKTFKTTMSEMEDNEDQSQEEMVYLDILNSDSDDKGTPPPSKKRKKRKNKKLRKVRINYFDDVYFEGLLENDYIKCHKDHLKEAFNLSKLLKKHREILNIPFHFSGNIIKGQKEGFCKEIYEDGSIFEGFYKQGKRQGKGFYRDIKDSSIYMGNFSNDEIQGSGVKIEDDGDKLVGEFQEGALVKGVIEYKNGIKYLGDLSNGVRHGKGKLIFNNDYVFEGQFVHDQISTAFEKGVLVDSKQNKYNCTYDESSNGNLKFFMFENEKILFIDKKNGELISFL
jgi:hypothetical protein